MLLSLPRVTFTKSRRLRKLRNNEEIPGQYWAERVLQFEAPLKFVRRGANQIEVTLQQSPPQKIVWLEVFIKPNR